MPGKGFTYGGIICLRPCSRAGLCTDILDVHVHTAWPVTVNALHVSQKIRHIPGLVLVCCCPLAQQCSVLSDMLSLWRFMHH